ncbi:MAG: hypothetical protein ACHP9Y_05840, partial [Gammaproteobacteria bacterium]
DYKYLTLHFFLQVPDLVATLKEILLTKPEDQKDLEQLAEVLRDFALQNTSLEEFAKIIPKKDTGFSWFKLVEKNLTSEQKNLYYTRHPLARPYEDTFVKTPAMIQAELARNINDSQVAANEYLIEATSYLQAAIAHTVEVERGFVAAQQQQVYAAAYADIAINGQLKTSEIQEAVDDRNEALNLMREFYSEARVALPAAQTAAKSCRPIAKYAQVAAIAARDAFNQLKKLNNSSSQQMQACEQWVLLAESAAQEVASIVDFTFAFEGLKLPRELSPKTFSEVERIVNAVRAVRDRLINTQEPEVAEQAEEFTVTPDVSASFYSSPKRSPIKPIKTAKPQGPVTPVVVHETQVRDLSIADIAPPLAIAAAPSTPRSPMTPQRNANQAGSDPTYASIGVTAVEDTENTVAKIASPTPETMVAVSTFSTPRSPATQLRTVVNQEGSDPTYASASIVVDVMPEKVVEDVVSPSKAELSGNKKMVLGPQNTNLQASEYTSVATTEKRSTKRRLVFSENTANAADAKENYQDGNRPAPAPPFVFSALVR